MPSLILLLHRRAASLNRVVIRVWQTRTDTSTSVAQQRPPDDRRTLGSNGRSEQHHDDVMPYRQQFINELTQTESFTRPAQWSAPLKAERIVLPLPLLLIIHHEQHSYRVECSAQLGSPGGSKQRPCCARCASVWSTTVLRSHTMIG